MAAAVILLQLPSLLAPHHEGDEAVLTFLAERLRVEPLDYSVQGALEGDAARRFIADTWIHTYGALPAPEGELAVQALRRLDRVELTVDPLQPGRRVFDPEIYDHPVFIHPPVYPALLAASRLMLGSRGGPLLSILVHVATVLAVGLLGRLWFGDKVGVLAAVLVGLEPVTWLAGSHMWTDGLAELNVVLAMLAAALALRSDRTRGFAAAGVVLSVALVTKYPAVLVAPAIYVAFSIAERRPAARDRWVYLAGAASLIVPWLLLFRLGYGAWLPVTKPTPWLMETYAYVKMMAARPWHFYLSGLVCVAPVGLFGIAAIGEVRRQRPVRVLLTWAATAVVVMTALGISGHGMQLRYLGPGIPAICLLASVGIARIRSRTGLAVAGVATVVTFVSSLANARFAEPFPTALVYVAQQLGLPIETWLGGMW